MIRYLPNALSILRLLLAPVAGYAVFKAYDLVALSLIFIALVTDILDGWIARTYRAETSVGSILDPLADKVFIVFMFTTLALVNRLSFWIAGAVTGREIFLILGGVILLKNRQMTLPPTWLSKINTFFQCMVGVSVLMHWPLWPSLAFMLAGSSISTLIYGIQGWKVITTHKKHL